MKKTKIQETVCCTISIIRVAVFSGKKEMGSYITYKVNPDLGKNTNDLLGHHIIERFENVVSFLDQQKRK